METTLALSALLLPILINLIVFTALILIVRYIVQARNRERLALIEKGVDLSGLYAKKEGGNILYFTNTHSLWLSPDSRCFK